MAKENSPQCESCGYDLTNKQHTLTECRKYKTERLNFNISEHLDPSPGHGQDRNEAILDSLKNTNLFS